MKPVLWIITDENGLPLEQEGTSPPGTEPSDWASYMWFSYDTIASFYRDYLSSSIHDVLIESKDHIVKVNPLKKGYILVALYPRSYPLGMILLTHKKILQNALKRIERILQEAGVEEGVIPQERRRMQKLIGFLQAKAPDPAFVVSRISLKTGIPPERILKAEVTAEEYDAIEHAAKELLGIKELII